MKNTPFVFSMQYYPTNGVQFKYTLLLYSVYPLPHKTEKQDEQHKPSADKAEHRKPCKQRIPSVAHGLPCGKRIAAGDLRFKLFLPALAGLIPGHALHIHVDDGAAVVVIILSLIGCHRY